MWTMLSIIAFGFMVVWLIFCMCEMASGDDDFVDEWMEKEGDDDEG